MERKEFPHLLTKAPTQLAVANSGME